jgi:hypothetical protein
VLLKSQFDFLVLSVNYEYTRRNITAGNYLQVRYSKVEDANAQIIVIPTLFHEHLSPFNYRVQEVTDLEHWLTA